MFKCLIIDDEQPAIEVLKKYVQKTSNLELTGYTTDPLEGVKLIAEKNVDVVFLDIRMDELSGLELTRMIDPKVQIIFCTGYSQFAAESYDLNAVDYLLKPIAFNRFLKAVGRLRGYTPPVSIQNIPDLKNDYIFVKTGGKGKMQKVNLDEILYAEAKNNFIIIFLEDNREILVNSTLKDLDKMIGGDNFIRIHHSFLISLDKVSEVENNHVCLQNTRKTAPISAGYRNDFIEKLQRLTLKRK